MSRVAWLSPLPPEASGIADYSAELLGGLQHRFDIELYCGAPGSLPESLRGMPARDYGQFLAEHRRRPYAAILYQIGNNHEYHSEIYWLLREQPGVVVLHEYMLHHLVRHVGGADEFVWAMRYSYGLAAEQTAREMVAGQWQNERWSYPLFEPVVDAADRLIVHGEVARARVCASRPAAEVTVVPHPVLLGEMPAVSDASRLTLHARLGIEDAALLLASFGHVTPSKRIDVVLRAFRRLRQSRPEARYVLAGEISPYYPEIRELLKGELGEGVVVTGYLSLPDLLALMEMTDVAFNLRSPTGGETSGVCVRLLGLGTPVIVNKGGWFSEIPDGCCARVSVGATEEDELVAVLEVLAGDPALRQEMGRAAAVWAARTRSFEKTVDGYTAVLERATHAGPRPGPAVYIEPPPPDGRAATGLVRDVAAAAAGLGVRDDDEALLPNLVDTMAQLGLTDQPFDDHQVSPTNNGWQLAPPEGPDLGTGWRKRLRGFVWRFVGPLFQRQEAFNATLVDLVNRNAQIAREQQQTIDSLSARVNDVAGKIDGVSTSIEGVSDELWRRWEATEARFAALEGEVAGRIDGVSTSIEGVSDELWRRWEATEARFAALEELRTTVGQVQHAVLTLKRELRHVTAASPDAAQARPDAAGATRVEEALDAYTYVGFENRFRGSEAEIRGRQVDYAPLFDGTSNILDVGCGRGEFLDVLRERGITARGLDLNGEMVEVCRSHGLEAEVGDALAYLRGLPDASLGGMFAAQVVEHLDPQYLIRLLAVAFQKLRPGSKIVLETINPQCWFAFFDSYLRDITHAQPLHPDTLQYLLVASGFQRTTVRYSAPYPEHAKLQHVALASRPVPTLRSSGLTSAVAVVNANVDKLNRLLFTHMDYAAIGERL